MSATDTLQSYDITIVGGGMVGAALACAFADSPLSVALVEYQKPNLPWPRKDFDIRVSAISRASQRILESLQVWPHIIAMRASAYEDMHVWDASGNGVIHFDCADIGEASLGHIIENSVIQGALYKRLEEMPNLTMLCPATPKAMVSDLNGYILKLDQNRTIKTQLLVGADGARSWIRQTAGISVDSHNYEQKAVVATVKTEHHHQNTAWQVFLPQGPLAFLPLTEGYSSIVWSTSYEHAAEILAMDDEDFKTALAQAFNHTLGEIISTSERAAFPLRSQHARQYVKPGLALIGDAAHTIHPLAGQGVNLGFADAASLAEVVNDAHAHGGIIGDYSVLRRYERWRKGDNVAMLTAMRSFKSVFGSNSIVVRGARNSGFNLTNRMTPVKNVFIAYAMGLVGDLPQMARPTIHT